MRIVAGVAALVLLLGGVTVGSEAAVAALSSASRPDDVSMVSQNVLRDDWDPNEPNLSPAVIKSGGFGQLFATKVIGQVYAQPLVIDNPGTATSAPSGSVIVATEMNYVYSLDSATGAVQWSVNLGTPWAEAAFPCTDLEPDIGITSTPVYDASTNTLYVFAVTADGNTMTTTPTDTLYALNASAPA
jgi:outer membrane protein assembly factor BamB